MISAGQELGWAASGGRSKELAIGKEEREERRTGRNGKGGERKEKENEKKIREKKKIKIF